MLGGPFVLLGRLQLAEDLDDLPSMNGSSILLLAWDDPGCQSRLDQAVHLQPGRC